MSKSKQKHTVAHVFGKHQGCGSAIYVDGVLVIDEGLGTHIDLLAALGIEVTELESNVGMDPFPTKLTKGGYKAKGYWYKPFQKNTPETKSD